MNKGENMTCNLEKNQSLNIGAEIREKVDLVEKRFELRMIMLHLLKDINEYGQKELNRGVQEWKTTLCEMKISLDDVNNQFETLE